MIAMQASNCQSMLKGYLEMCRVRKERAIKRTSYIIQIISYSLIGIVLIMVYSVLMAPLKVLESLWIKQKRKKGLPF